MQIISFQGFTYLRGRQSVLWVWIPTVFHYTSQFGTLENIFGQCRALTVKDDKDNPRIIHYIQEGNLSSENLLVPLESIKSRKQLLTSMTVIANAKTSAFVLTTTCTNN
jgi:hypothetical protein